MKTAVGLSGGVDSSVAALLLKREGHQVAGITMRILQTDDDSACDDARRVAEHLEIPLTVVDLRREYENTILRYIREDYAAGRTPNPCVRCNREVKFGLFLEKAHQAGGDFDCFATGHYAIIDTDPATGRKALRKGLHGEKDQAYFLSLLTQEQLSQTLFPLGRMTKPEVREIAREAGLFTHRKGESQDLCLGGYRQYLSSGRGEGDFTDAAGRFLGRHRGIEHYTIGQRRGLGIGGGEPLYVVAIREEENRVILGRDGDLFARGMLIREVNWGVVEDPPVPFAGTVKIRYRDGGTPAVLEGADEPGLYRIRFEEPRRAVTPGQLAVFYRGDYVAFAGFIQKAL